MLMDLFFAVEPPEKKRRVHFHAFMLDVHDRIEHERRAHTDEPVAKVAADLAAEATLLCFDEFQVNDIADAMIIERLFRGLFDAGTVVVATSNRHPSDSMRTGCSATAFCRSSRCWGSGSMVFSSTVAATTASPECAAGKSITAQTMRRRERRSKPLSPI